MARRAALDMDGRPRRVGENAALALVAGFPHSELETLALRANWRNYVAIGALQVSESGDIATSCLTLRDSPSDGRAGESHTGALEPDVIVVMDHCEKDGSPRIVRTCALAVAGHGVVKRVVTELAAIDVTPEGLILREVAPGVSARDVQDHTEPTLKIDPDLREMRPA
jgi:3-oxoacid CoA-transferase subunit B